MAVEVRRLKPPPTKVPLLASCFDFFPPILAPADLALKVRMEMFSGSGSVKL